MYSTECHLVSNSFPPLSVFEGTIVEKLTAAYKGENRPSCFVHVVCSVKDKQWTTDHELAFYQAAVNIVREMDMKAPMYEVVMRLIRWEWSDRVRLALQIINLGYKFTEEQSSVCWCVLAMNDELYHTRIIHRLRSKYGLWHDEEEMKLRTRVAPHDLATFLIILHRGWTLREHVVVEQEWYRTFRDVFAIQNWPFIQVIRLLLCVQSSFGHQAIQHLYLTPSQRQTYEKYMQKTWITNTDECVDTLVLAAVKTRAIPSRND
jgi:hypothetical protein